MTRLLLDDRFWPITSEIGFLEYGAVDLLREYLAWTEWAEQQDLEPEAFMDEGVVVEEYVGPEAPPPWPRLPPGEPVYDVQPVEGGVEDAVRSLLPLTIGANARVLLVPTAGPWTAYFDNGSGGTDAFPPMSYLARRLQTRGLRAVAVPARSGRPSASIFELYGPEEYDWLNVRRAVSAMRDGDRWRFDTVGEPLPFEDVERYRARRVRDRFPHDLLDRYLRELGVQAFEDGFYMPDGTAFLLQSRKPEVLALDTVTLEQAQADEHAPPPPTALPAVRGGLVETVRRLFRR